MLMANLNESVIRASNAARDSFLSRIDAAAPPPVAASTPANARALRPDFYKDSFFGLVQSALKLSLADDLLQTTGSTWGFAGWFNYFAGEAKTVPLEEQGRLLTLVLDLDMVLERNGKALRKRTTATPPLPLAAAFAQLVKNDPAGAPLGVLQYLLDFGFVSKASVDASAGRMDVGGGGGSKVSHTFGNAFGLQAAHKGAPAERDAQDGFLLYYRGDTRTPATVISQGGAKCRADLAGWVRDNHVKAMWHPWKDDTERGKMWLRKGNGDNDYYTVNSIGMDFHISCAYPMFQLGKVHPDFKGHVSEWNDALRERLRRTGKADARLTRHRTRGVEWALTDTSRVYLCVFPADTALSPTYDLGNNYPEAGVREVPLNQIVAWFEIDRYHNNDDLRSTGAYPQGYYASNGDGGSMTIHIKRWGWLDADGQGKNILGLADPSVLANRLNSYLGKLFEITHDRLVSVSQTTYLPGNQRVGAMVHPAVKPAVLKR